MNATSSGVASSAAKIRSPSFSRSSSSTTTTGLAGGDVGDGSLDRVERHDEVSSSVGGPAAVPTGAMQAAYGQQPLDVLGEDVDLEVDRLADLAVPERRRAKRLGDQADGEPVVARPRRR